MVNIFKKAGRSIGSIFKKAGRGIASIAKKIDPFEATGSIAGSGIGSAIGAGVGELIAPEGGSISADVGSLIGGQIGSIVGGQAGKSYSDSLRRIHHTHGGRPVDPKYTGGSRLPVKMTVTDTLGEAKRSKMQKMADQKKPFLPGVPTPKKQFLPGVPTPQPYIKRPPKQPTNELEKAKPIRDKKQDLFV